MSTEKLSKEELAKRRQEITDYYADHIPHLKVQCEYEELLTKIEENRARKVQAEIMIAQMIASQEENPGNTEAREEFEQQLENQRKLKK